PVLSGWFGHAAPFDFDDTYRPTSGIERFLCGTPAVLGLTALEVGVEVMLEADMAQVCAKSLALAELLMRAMEPLCAGFGFTLASPADPAERGSQLSYAHPEGYAVVQALKALDVIADFRAPDLVRFGLTPLYLRHTDAIEAAERLEHVCRERLWDRPEFRERAAVT
ncbi:MAG: kynureninase/PvdN C-terminal domain-containing protein, partial [Tsuneonella sp.]